MSSLSPVPTSLWCAVRSGHVINLLSEKKRCLDAFIVALSQACEGKGKHWYSSTLELQLTSLEFYRACRSVPTLDVSVNDRTPRELWAPRGTQTESNAHESNKKARISRRVPALRGVCLTWAPPVEVLVQDASVELWEG